MRSWSYLLPLSFAASLPGIIGAVERGDLRELNRLQFEGIQSFAVADARIALASSYDVALASHPDVPLPDYLRALENTMLSACHHSGFAAAAVRAEYDETRSAIVVHLTEGPRHFCGDAIVTNATTSSVESLIAAITTPAKK